MRQYLIHVVFIDKKENHISVISELFYYQYY